MCIEDQTDHRSYCSWPTLNDRPHVNSNESPITLWLRSSLGLHDHYVNIDNIDWDLIYHFLSLINTNILPFTIRQCTFMSLIFPFESYKLHSRLIYFPLRVTNDTFEPCLQPPVARMLHKRTLKTLVKVSDLGQSYI